MPEILKLEPRTPVLKDAHAGICWLHVGSQSLPNPVFLCDLIGAGVTCRSAVTLLGHGTGGELRDRGFPPLEAIQMF